MVCFFHVSQVGSSGSEGRKQLCVTIGMVSDGCKLRIELKSNLHSKDDPQWCAVLSTGFDRISSCLRKAKCRSLALFSPGLPGWASRHRLRSLSIFLFKNGTFPIRNAACRPRLDRNDFYHRRCTFDRAAKSCRSWPNLVVSCFATTIANSPNAPFLPLMPKTIWSELRISKNAREKVLASGFRSLRLYRIKCRRISSQNDW